MRTTQRYSVKRGNVQAGKRKSLQFVAAVSLAVLCFTGAARADVVYQSIPDLTVAAPAALNGTCSKCGSGSQQAGENFTLTAGTTVTGASFDVTTPPVGYVPNQFGGPVWPVPVTVSIYADAGGQILGAQLFSETYSTFLSDIVTSSPTPSQSGSDLVSVAIPDLVLASGTYDIFLTDPVNLEVPEYYNGAGLGIIVSDLLRRPLPAICGQMATTIPIMILEFFSTALRALKAIRLRRYRNPVHLPCSLRL
jgi:hypothetical protein